MAKGFKGLVFDILRKPIATADLCLRSQTDIAEIIKELHRLTVSPRRMSSFNRNIKFVESQITVFIYHSLVMAKRHNIDIEKRYFSYYGVSNESRQIIEKHKESSRNGK